jgi:uncharacterized protein
MRTTATPEQVFRALVDGVAAERWDELSLLYAERTNVVHPFDPLRSPPLRSRRDLAAHFDQSRAAGSLARVPANITVHETTDPEVVVAEFEYRGATADTGRGFAIPCIFVIRVRAGKIIESRDYIDHLASADARGQLDALIDAIHERVAAGIRVSDVRGPREMSQVADAGGACSRGGREARTL